MIDMQSFSLNILVYVVVFVGVLFAYEGLLQLIFRRETRGEARNRRMRMIQRGASGDEILQLLRDPAMFGSRAKQGPITRFRRLLIQAGVTISTAWILLGAFGLGAITFVGANIYLVTDLSLAISVAVAVLLPIIILLSMKRARLDKLSKQLPDTLDLMSRGLKVGHPVAVTIGNVAKDMPDPIGTEFGIIHDQINYGDDVATAFHDFAKRVSTEDANYLAVSISIQHGTGGNLGRILDVLSQVIRDRYTMRKKIKAISAEGRLSGLILTALPVFIYVTIELSSPSFYGDVRGDPWFPTFAFAIIGLIVAQGLILYRLVNFKF
tara:strand:- start:186169 stop:187137 length:969 start_codon:yes stop_codon:yes gene_type:complete